MIAVAGVAIVATLLAVWAIASAKRRGALSEAGEILKRAEQDAATTLRAAEIEAKAKAIQQTEVAEKEFRKTRQELHERERSLDKRQDVLDKQAEDIRKQEKLVETTQRKLAERLEDANRRNEELGKLIGTQRQTLHEISGLGKAEATDRLLRSLETQLQDEAGAIILRHERAMKEKCEEIARNLLLLAMQRFAASHTAEATTCTVDIPNDEMKGRIIGREGRNIRAFEKATGVDIIIDDTPGV
ncbi:MAG TPA: ribonuclease Y, partial [Planctomycetaceae bacterium]|nr:ribonuclease Y [Planctomycetaceae bacterium]